jgi:hypothetical protein
LFRKLKVRILIRLLKNYNNFFNSLIIFIMISLSIFLVLLQLMAAYTLCTQFSNLQIDPNFRFSKLRILRYSPYFVMLTWSSIGLIAGSYVKKKNSFFFLIAIIIFLLLLLLDTFNIFWFSWGFFISYFYKNIYESE